MSHIQLDQFSPGQATVLRSIVEAADHRCAYLVGGAVRDLLLAHPVSDLDVVVPAGARTLARILAARLGGTFVELDDDRGVARVALHGGAAGQPNRGAETDDYRQIDVADFRAPTLAGDLGDRDFTVNALALPLGSLTRDGEARIVDPLRGLADLAARRLRPAGPGVIERDPVRALRGVRFEAAFGMRLEATATRAIRRAALALATSAVERVAQELMAILELPRCVKALRRADRLGILAVILPEIGPMRATPQPPPHRFDVLEHSLRAVGAVDRLLAGFAAGRRCPGLDAKSLAEPLGGEVTRAGILRFAALLHDVSKPESRSIEAGRVRFIGHDRVGAARARAIGERLRLPARAVRLLETLVRHHLRVMHLEQAGTLTGRARYRFYRDVDDTVPELLMLALADAAALDGRSPFTVWRRSRVVQALSTGIPGDRTARATPPLLRGEDVMAAFDLRPGREVGRLLGSAREVQDLGLIHTRDEALDYLRRERHRLAATPGGIMRP